MAVLYSQWFYVKKFFILGVKSFTNPDPDKYGYSSHGIFFDVSGTSSLSIDGFGKNVVIFGADISLFVQVHNK